MTLARRLKPIHLRLILRIAETGKLHSAANDVVMSQPAASRMLSEIELLTGAALFERHAKGMTLTPVGKTFARHAKRILLDLDSLDTEVSATKSGRAGSVRIGSVTGPAVGSLVPAIRVVRQTSPEVEFTVEVAPSITLMRRLDEGAFDFVIGRIPPEYNSRSYRLFPARNEVVSLLVGRSHPMAGRQGVHLQELVDFEWIIQERGAPIRAAVEGVFHTHGIRMPAQVTNSSSLLVALATLEGSNAIAPQSREVIDLLTGPALNMNVTKLDLVEEILVSPVFVIIDQDRQLSPLAERVIEEILHRL